METENAIETTLEQSLIKITEHAYDRAKERLSLSKKAFDRLAVKAYVDGVTHQMAKGNLKKYITKLWMEYRQANNTKIYGNNLFLFKNNTLITVYQVPNHLRKLVAISK